ncbi:unnamed protein product [Eruca vesicaria subsp. sativa]|uniref:Pentatricopeptide repeat-containing protein n=1 Tax=Eruca vesicaria subsp. sativa TaxID=29727 RepID=A0ABC8JZC4_ERUVS|nr:unnamed protein product [Eruca vesicaria subsp. sativa]
MDLYSIFKNSNDACKVFDEIPKRDIVSYNVLITCFLRLLRTRDVLYHFDNMIKNGSVNKPDSVTCLLALQDCACVQLQMEERRMLQILFTLDVGLVIDTVVIPCDRGRTTDGFEEKSHCC